MELGFISSLGFYRGLSFLPTLGLLPLFRSAEQNLLDESGNKLTDENGNYLK